MRFILSLLLVAVAGVALGGATAWYSIQQSHRIGAINIGPWTAFLFVTAEEADPYTIARSVAESTVPLGATEGVSFEAVTDSQGQELDRRCRYRIEGTVPPAKLWTLVAYGAGGRQIEPAPGGSSAQNSNAILRFADGSFLITVSQRPSAGNWLATSGEGRMRFVLRLYDTPLASRAGLTLPSMPLIVREECAA